MNAFVRSCVLRALTLSSLPKGAFDFSLLREITGAAGFRRRVNAFASLISVGPRRRRRKTRNSRTAVIQF
jgi:hypothetical protein